MIAWMHRQMGLVVSVLLTLSLIAPLATPASAQEDAPAADTPVEVAEPANTEPEPLRRQP